MYCQAVQDRGEGKVSHDGDLDSVDDRSRKVECKECISDNVKASLDVERFSLSA